MVKILLVGCNGRMGSAITQAVGKCDDLVISAGVDLLENSSGAYPVYANHASVKEAFDVIIDFSHPSSLGRSVELAVSGPKPLVMATTGLSASDIALLKDASRHTAVLRSANMSVGVNLMTKLVQQAARALYLNFDIEIVEKHHSKKADSPSGTSLAIADSILEAISSVDADSERIKLVHGRHGNSTARTKNEIGMHAIRGGTIAGEHSVLFAGKDELLEITHTALSRSIFVEGALAAARYLAGKPNGFYTMQSMLD